MTLTAHQFIYKVIDTFINFFFNQFQLPNSPNVYVGWVIVSVLTFGITINAILNIGKSVPKIRKEK